MGKITREKTEEHVEDPKAGGTVQQSESRYVWLEGRSWGDVAELEW